MQKFDLKQTIRRVRQNWWFEKYIWFISSETLEASLSERTDLMLQVPHAVARFGVVALLTLRIPPSSWVVGCMFQWGLHKASCLAFRNYLVISGHDAIQTEQLFLKHVGPNDAFVQADVAGARTCFVRNPSGGNDTVHECFL